MIRCWRSRAAQSFRHSTSRFSEAKLLGRVRMYDFALVEVIEYLDGHPDNAAALKYYNEMRTAFDKAAAEYEDAFGPLTAREVDTRSGHWTWIDDPWPWEGAED